MSNFKRAPQPGSVQPPRTSILSTLQATTMLDSKAILPAEIIDAILDYLPVSDLLRFARTSRRMREMVYDDTRWISRLKSMGCWDDVEARTRFEEAMKRKRETSSGKLSNGNIARQTIFDASVEEQRRDNAGIGGPLAASTPHQVDGFETLSIGAQRQKSAKDDPETIINVLKGVRSARGYARQEYGRIYGALAPFYFDLVESKSHSDPAVFKVFRDPEKQAQMLQNLQAFCKSDWSQGWRQREETLQSMSAVFENAVVREFEQGYEFWDVDGRMKRYAHVLHTLNGGSAATELYISKHPIFSDREDLANPMNCINQGSYENITLEPSRQFFDALAAKVNGQAEVMGRIFPRPAEVFWAFVDKIREEIIMEYVTPLLDEAHENNLSSYLKAVSGLFEQCLQFARSLQTPGEFEGNLEDQIKDVALKVFEPHLDLYLQEEVDFFTRHAEREVRNWEQKLTEQDATVESFYMSNFNRQADKKDFLSSFRKVVMMPVTVLPSAISSPFGGSSGSKPPATSAANGSTLQPGVVPAFQASQPNTSSVGGSFERKGSPLPSEAPTDELKAKAALMANRLEGIKTLFSIEVALDLVHAAKTSLGRAAVFVRLGGQAGEEAREQCEAIFVVLTKILGNSHVRAGFDKAIEHLSHYNPREVSDHSQTGVAPLVMFIELVNVGDLISQMIDVFYEQQLVANKIADRNDFLDPAGLAKKKWEQMLDEKVAAGLNKGIDVLMDEVEYLNATTQLPSDYNPPVDAKSGLVTTDLGPTQTSRRIVDLVSSHTRMLVGSTEKTMLDVFNGEVGLRLFTAVCKHLKRQRISTDGAINVIADMNLYFDYIKTLKNQDLLAYFKALRELSQIFLIDARHAKEMAAVIADGDRFGGIFRAEEVYEYAQRRADWFQVKRDVERAMYGMECCVM